MPMFTFEEFQRMRDLEAFGFTTIQKDGVTEQQIQNEFWKEVASTIIMTTGDVIPLRVTPVWGLSGDTYKMFGLIYADGERSIQVRLFDTLEQAEGMAMLYGTPTKRVHRGFQLKIEMVPNGYGTVR